MLQICACCNLGDKDLNSSLTPLSVFVSECLPGCVQKDGCGRTSDCFLPMVPLCHSWLFLWGHVHSCLGVCGQLQLEVPRCYQRVGTLHLWHLHPHCGEDVSVSQRQVSHFSALLHLHPLDVSLGVHHWPHPTPVQCLPMGLFPVWFWLHGPDHPGVCHPMVLCFFHHGTAGDQEHPALAIWWDCRARGSHCPRCLGQWPREDGLNHDSEPPLAIWESPDLFHRLLALALRYCSLLYDKIHKPHFSNGGVHGIYQKKNGTNRFSKDFTLWVPRTNISYLLVRLFLILTYYRWKQSFCLHFCVEKEEGGKEC